MMRLVHEPEDLPVGSHAVSFYGAPPEAARGIASFLKGAHDRKQTAIILTSDDRMLELYRREVSQRVPAMLNALRRIPGPHVRPTAEGLRPVPEAMEFVVAHPEGATMAADTLPGILDRRTLPDILAYEGWFDGLRPFRHRGLCPYDLSRLPVDRAPETLGRLARAHSHGVLSSDPNPGVRFLQLLVLPHVENPPAEHLGWLARAVDFGLMEERPQEETVGLTPRGEDFARALLGLPDYVQEAAAAAQSRRRPHLEPELGTPSSGFRPEDS